MHGDTHSFIVRIWHEAIDRDGQRIIWRGLIDHVGTGKRRYFNDDLNSITGFIEEEVGGRARPASPGWRALLVGAKNIPKRLAEIWGMLH